jgi:hypothetical protein
MKYLKKISLLTDSHKVSNELLSDTDIEDIKIDIEGLLVELKDGGLITGYDVYENRLIVKISNINNRHIFNTNDLKDKLDTLCTIEDYLNVKGLTYKFIVLDGGRLNGYNSFREIVGNTLYYIKVNIKLL